MFVHIMDANVPKSAFVPLNFIVRYSHFDYPCTLFSILMVIGGVYVSYCFVNLVEEMQDQLGDTD
jgi:hypothetical protein